MLGHSINRILNISYQHISYCYTTVHTTVMINTLKTTQLIYSFYTFIELVML